MMPGIWAVIPVKDLDGAKGRLAPVLAMEQRRQLFCLMLEDVLTALRACPGLSGLALVTRDADAAGLAGSYGARVLVEPENRGQSAAVAHGAEILAAEGAAGILAVPADVPLVTAAEIARLLAAHGSAPAVTIAPAADRRGTNGLLCSPPRAIPFHFGDDSFRPHAAAARDAGIEPRVVDLPGFALDVDRPGDLDALATRPGQSRAQAWLRRRH